MGGAFGAGTFVVAGADILLHSADGVLFEPVSRPYGGIALHYQGVTFGKGKFYAAGRSRLVLLNSSDGIHWP